ncbi:sensor domain-containing diguanylate cyclase [Azoarcus olearius]|uniref:diguanylate cyclase n=1 Tax=Azoarcus sp. (strain BH72) TaxID=418699 RepID=A1K8W1_AZOSB|nr:sensor domain-containing diguanylate cyclase [Azoarcus olearius]CAL95266.1 GGDEF family protein [Azoarcus olearius]
MNVLPRSLQNQLAALFGALALLVGLPTYFYIDHIHAQQLVRDRGQALHELAGAVAMVVAENLNERKREIDLLAQRPSFRRGPLDGADLRTGIEALKNSYPHYSWIGLADTQGVVRAASGDMLVGQSVAQRPWFGGGLLGSFLGDVHEAVLLTKLLQVPPGEGPVRFIDFAAPVYDEQGVLRGVVAAHAHWRWAADVVAAVMPRNAAEKQIEVFLVNRDGKIIFPERDLPVDAVPAAVSTHTTYSFDNWGSDSSFLSARVNVRELVDGQPLGWSVVVRQPRERAMADLRALQELVVCVALGAAAAFLALAWWSAGRMSRPLEQLAGLAKRIQQGEEHLALEVRGTSAEVVKLVGAMRGMASTLVSRKHSLELSNLALEQKVAERTAELQRLNAELVQLARRDALTGLPNRLAANEQLTEEFLRMKRSLVPYAVLMADIDLFKRINDGHGHAVGDAVLRHVAGVIRSSLRITDFVARVGGEEFLVLLPNTDIEAAAVVAEKIRVAVEGAAAPEVGQVTLSIGVGRAVSAHPSPDDAVRLADDGLYEAKRLGRNRISVVGVALAGVADAGEA